MLDYNGCDDVWLATEAVDFRKGARSLLALSRHVIGLSLTERKWLAFTNRKRTAVKVLAVDETGCWLSIKYFDKGTLAFWPKPGKSLVNITARQLSLLLDQRLY
jgi:hypothetical protein